MGTVIWREREVGPSKDSDERVLQVGYDGCLSILRVHRYLF